MTEPVQLGGIVPNRICGRWMGGTLGGDDEVVCGNHAFVHVFWVEADYPDNSYFCRRHWPEALKRRPWRYHALGPCCGMPGSVLDTIENTCRYEDDEIPTVEPRRQSIPA